MHFPSRAATASYQQRSFFALACVAILVCLATVQGQTGSGVDSTGTGGRHTIKGRIYFPSGRRSDVGVKVKLESYSSGGLNVLSDANGSFTFTGLTSGSYRVMVDGGDEYESVAEPVYIETDAPSPRNDVTVVPISRLYTVQISLQLKQRNSVKPTVVNAALANVPANARDSYEKGLEAARASDSKKAIEELKSALIVYPEFPLALNELGVQYLKLGQADKAAEVLGRAVKLALQDFQPRLNYGIALLNQRRFAEAEEQLKTAIGINGSAPTTHMYLGITLINLHRLNEAQEELETAVNSNSNEVGLAHRYLGGVYWGNRDYKRAADELETYLKLFPKAADAERTRTAIKELRSKS